MAANNDESLDWTPVIGRAMSYLCLCHGEMTEKPLVDQADFLSRLGIPRKEAAQLLGTTDNSLRVMLGQRSQKLAKKAGPLRKATKSDGK